jgi:crossover junction endodeoxyribonuclease RusA
MTAEGKVLKESYGWQLKTQWRNKVIRGDVELEIDLFFKDKRRRDIDNFSKILNDSMSGIVFEDDSQIQKATVVKHINEENPRVEIIVKTI